MEPHDIAGERLAQWKGRPVVVRLTDGREEYGELTGIDEGALVLGSGDQAVVIFRHAIAAVRLRPGGSPGRRLVTG